MGGQLKANGVKASICRAFEVDEDAPSIIVGFEIRMQGRCPICEGEARTQHVRRPFHVALPTKRIRTFCTSRYPSATLAFILVGIEVTAAYVVAQNTLQRMNARMGVGWGET
jgi:hypothetical protein